MQSTRTGIHLLNGAVHRHCPFWRSNGKYLLVMSISHFDPELTRRGELSVLSDVG